MGWSYRWVKLKVFFLLDWLQQQGKRTQSALQSNYSGERTDGFMIFSKALISSEKQTASPRIWTLIVKSIFHYDNHGAGSASKDAIKLDTSTNYSQMFLDFSDLNAEEAVSRKLMEAILFSSFSLQRPAIQIFIS